MTLYYHIKDRCRKGLVKYLELACANIPKNNHYKILDIGCGTGVPTLWLAEHFSGTITAIDNNDQAISYLQQKIRDKNLQDRVKANVASFFDFDFDPNGYDLILAEGFLNIIGFKNGFGRIINLVNKKGYLIIHDDYKDHDWKCGFIKTNDCELIETIILDEKTWWNDYYRQLEEEISQIRDVQTRELFLSDQEEIKMNRVNPSHFQSIYYVIRKS